MKVNFGYPWGCCECNNPLNVRVVPAACSAESHFAHPFCTPGWEESNTGGVVLAGPFFTDSGWQVLVEFPDEQAFGFSPDFEPVLPDECGVLVIRPEDWAVVKDAWWQGLRAGLSPQQLDGIILITLSELGYN